MLWEDVDPVERLTDRFGFADPGAAAEWVADELRRRWTLEVTGCDRVVVSSWNAMAWITVGEQRLIAKWCALHARFARLLDAAAVTSWLDFRNVPVAAPIPTIDGRLLVEGDGARGRLRSASPGSRTLLGVFPVVDGELLDVDDTTQVADAGRMLAVVHEELAAYPGRVGGRHPRGRRQLVHHDFRSANLLHDGTRITAVLDLEEITYATRVADLARSAVLLGTRYRDWGPTSPDTRSAYVAAYDDQAVHPLTAPERRGLEHQITAVMASMGWTSDPA